MRKWDNAKVVRKCI